MPLIQIHMVEGRTDEQKAALLKGITEVTHETIGAPISSIRVWIIELPKHHFMAAGELASERKPPDSV